MKRIALIAAATLSIGAVQLASAADMPVKAPVAVAPAFSWAGCYIGANTGWVGSGNRFNLAPSGSYLNPVGGAAPPNVAGTGDFPASIAAVSHSYDGSGSGWLAGAQIGCNQQYGALVIGAEADWQWTSLRTSADAAFAAFPNPGNPVFTNTAHTEHVSSKLQWFSTVRGRIGYAFDRLLVYGTGGLAFGDVRSETNVTFAAAGVNPVYGGAVHIGSNSTTRFGWVLGAGGEYMFAGNWSIKAEYLYLNLGTYTYASPLVAATAAFAPGYSWSTTVRERQHIARIGLNFKFR